MLRRIVVLVADGFTDSGLSISLDIFRTANALTQHPSAKPNPTASRFAIEVASATGGTVRAASGLHVGPTRAVARALPRADIVLVPGLWAEGARELDALLARDDVKRLVRAIATAHARGAIIGSACGGAFLLAEAGLLDGRACTTTWWLAPYLKQRRPAAEVDPARALIADRTVLTAGAVFAQADLALHLVGRFAGPAVARRCARLLLLDAHPSQAPYMAVHQLAANDPTVRRAEDWVRKHLAHDFDIAALARGSGTSARTLARRLDAAVGLSPIAFIQRLRVETAVHLLETTRLSLQEVAARVGYADPGALRRLIQREAHATPRELRMRGRQREPAVAHA
jgi:transcriptional regulator GlxA family with amidase domain